jgi:hypothetical protein
MFMASGEMQKIGKGKDARLTKAGWQKARMGSILDYNTDYLQSEFEVLADGLVRIEKVKMLQQVDELANIHGALKAEAKAWNTAETVRRANPKRPDGTQW